MALDAYATGDKFHHEHGQNGRYRGDIWLFAPSVPEWKPTPVVLAKNDGSGGTII
ncbi:hypothetical protein [Sphingorhabdus sp. M41]|uniref:hypothetical protein n=1 Tax=Sphingorhabdus sp. M41 TaxID=1806885 RepID=UPI0012E7C1B5|nr:hypothetical protein [Sphingorhabdus sp. M41]